MIWRDDDLRCALAPLAGDPRADARRVLAALVDEPVPQRPPLRRLPWGWISGCAAAAAAGLLLGLALGTGGAEPPIEPPPPRVEGATLLASLGPVERISGSGIDERSEKLPAGATLPFGATFATAPATLAILRLPDGTHVAVDRSTRLRIESAERIELLAGRIQLHQRDAIQTTLTVHGPPGAALLGNADAEIAVEPGTLSVYAFADAVQIRNSEGLERRVRRHSRAWIVEDLMRDSSYAGPPGWVRMWTLPLFALVADQKDIDQTVDEHMIRVALEMRMAEFATMPIRALGVRALPALFAYLEQSRGKTDAMRTEIAAPLTALASRPDLPRLFELLGDADGGVRVVAQRAIIEVAGGMEYDDAFWRDAPAEERALRLGQWREKALGR